MPARSPPFFVLLLLLVYILDTGRGHGLSMTAAPSRVDIINEVHAVTAGGYNTAILTGTNVIEQYGFLASKIGEKQEIAVPLDGQSGENIKSVKCGGYHCLTLTSNGLVYMWKRNSDGEVMPPTRVNLPNNTDTVRSISCGYQFSILVTESGAVLSYGDGGRGQLGYGIIEHQSAPQVIEALQGRKIVDACAGGHHSLFLDDSGKVLATGANSFGQLGISATKDVSTPTEIPFFVNNPAKSISCGGDHSLAILQDGRVVGWGWGGRGQIGVGSTQEIIEPTIIEIDDIIQVSAGGYAHSLLLNSKGKVFVMGACDYGQCCRTDPHDITIPSEIRSLSNIKNIDAGGYKHSVFVDASGQVLVCGDDTYGQLGPRLDSDQPLDILIDENMFKFDEDVLMLS